MRGHPEFPIVRITLQGMEHSITHAMQEHFVQMDKQCAAAVKAAVESFDYPGEVRRMAYDLIQRAIKNALEKEISYGPTYKEIEEVARQIVRKKIGDIAL